MARWPSLLASALLATPVALPAQPGGMPDVEPARVIEAAEACRRAPADYRQALDHVRQQGFGDLPPDVRARMPYTTLTRKDVRLILIPGGMLPGSCKVYGNVGESPDFADLVARLGAALGEPPIPGDEDRAGWWFEDRTVHASHEGGSFWINVIFQNVSRAEMVNRGSRSASTGPPAAGAPVLAAPFRPPVATSPTSAPSSTADEFAAAAAACVAAAGGGSIKASEIRKAGWADESGRGGAAIFSRKGSNLRIFAMALAGGQCVVDGYGERRDGFEAIRDAIAARLAARYGGEAKLGQARGEEGAFSRGQGFTVGNRIAVLSSEQRDDGLSIRFTVMSLR